MRAYHHTLSWVGVSGALALSACSVPSLDLPFDEEAAALAAAPDAHLAEELAAFADDEPAPGPVQAVAALPAGKQLQASLVVLPLEREDVPACGRARLERELAACVNELVHRHVDPNRHLIIEITAVSTLRRFELTEPIFIFDRRHVTLRGRRAEGRSITLVASPELQRPSAADLAAFAEHSWIDRWFGDAPERPAPGRDRGYLVNIVDSDDVHLLDLRLEGRALPGLGAIGVCPTNERRVSHVSVERSLLRGFRAEAIVVGQAYASRRELDSVRVGLGQARLHAYAVRRAVEKVHVTCSGFVSNVAVVDNTVRMHAPALVVRPAPNGPAPDIADPLDWTQTPDPLARDNHTLLVHANRFIAGPRVALPYVLSFDRVQRVRIVNNVFRAEGGTSLSVRRGEAVERLEIAANQRDTRALTQVRVVDAAGVQ